MVRTCKSLTSGTCDPSRREHTYRLMCVQVREITNQVAPEPFRWTAEALLATQEVRRCDLHWPC